MINPKKKYKAINGETTVKIEYNFHPTYSIYEYKFNVLYSDGKQNLVTEQGKLYESDCESPYDLIEEILEEEKMNFESGKKYLTVENLEAIYIGKNPFREESRCFVFGYKDGFIQTDEEGKCHYCSNYSIKGPAPEKRVYERWVNVYKDREVERDSLEDAISITCEDIIARIHIRQEYTVGEGLEND